MAIRALPALLLILFLPHYVETSEAEFIHIDTPTSDGWRQHSEDPPPYYSIFWLATDGWRQDAEHNRQLMVKAVAGRFQLTETGASLYLDALIAASAKVRAAMDENIYSILCPTHTAPPQGAEIGVALNSLDGVRWSVQNAHLRAFNVQHPAQTNALIAHLAEEASDGVSFKEDHTQRDPGELEQHLTLICENRP